MPAFIETQFPIARLSAEAYKERKAGASQTLTGLGKWWGRKPLILVRASILGMLMPASDDPKKDREVFLKILTMDDDGAWERCKTAVQRKLSRTVFDKMPYAERIANCDRPENVQALSSRAWTEINEHLGTKAQSLAGLIDELGKRTFGHMPRVGDSFCGGGSIPFEAARIGCYAVASDLNPVAGLLTWAGLNLLRSGKDSQEKIRAEQEAIFAAADEKIVEWGIERNEKGERAEAFLYCLEVKPDGCDYYIPLAPNWVISEKHQVVTTWKRLHGRETLEPIISEVPSDELEAFKKKKGATVGESRVIDLFDISRSWSVESLRGPEGLRLWSNDDLVPRPGDVFQERLYCIRWINTKGERRYAAPDEADLAREAKVLELLKARFADWQRAGFIPSKAMPKDGEKTDEPIRTRGWTHWHHLFTPRQLLTIGLLNETSSRMGASPYSILGIGALAATNSKLCRWRSQLNKSGGIGAIEDSFSNQAFNPIFNPPCRGFSLCYEPFVKGVNFIHFNNKANSLVILSDARDLEEECDIWITDPPYADAINYHELGDFFLSWYEKRIAESFPAWTTDSRSELAVRGDGDDFRRSMVEIYSNLARHMPDNGMQMVMFTHQNPAVWADLGMILWAAGLKATAAWTISTETEAAGIKQGNYVQGTVCLVLRKRIGSEPGFLDEVYPLVEDEVKRQISSMQALDEGAESNFNDADYQLAAYAAALKVLTHYSSLDGKDVELEVFALRAKNEKSDFQVVIERALGIACDTLIPRGLEETWRELTLVERYYLRALDIESRGERRQGMYEELARGFGVTDIKPLLKSDKANGARMHTPIGLASSGLAPLVGSEVSPSKRGKGTSSTHPFATSALRHLLFAVRETASADNSPEMGRQYLRDTFGQAYWGKRESFISLLEWLSALGNADGMGEWTSASEAARILAGRLRNDHV